MLRSLRTACSNVASSVRAGLRATPPSRTNVAQRLPASRRDGACPRSSACADRPTRHEPFVHEAQQLSLAHHRVVELEARELRLLRRTLEPALADEPLVDVVVVLELERAERVRDPLDRVGQRVREVVQRIEAPRVALPVVRARDECAAGADRA